MDTRVYIFTGFLDSGKTTFIKDTLSSDEFTDHETTLLLVLEQGEITYDEASLKKHHCFIEYLNEDQINKESLTALQEKYQPTQVVIEFNGMMNPTELINGNIPNHWIIVQVLTTINASTFSLYINNMRSYIYNQVLHSELVIFNRVNDTIKKSYLRNNIKAINSTAQIVYEDESGTIVPFTNEELPYDIDLDFLDIKDHDFGIFCMDAMEHPDHYDGKRVKLKGKMMGQDKILENGFVLGRMAMVCCEEDTSLIGIICVSEYTSKLIPEEWLIVEGTIQKEYDADYGMDICILYVDKLEGTSPLQNEYVTFD